MTVPTPAYTGLGHTVALDPNQVPPAMQGPVAAGQAGNTYNPTLIGGLDASGLAQNFNCNQQIEVLTSQVRNSNTFSADQSNHNARGLIVFLNISAVTGASTGIQLFIQAKDKEGNYYQLNAGPAALTAAGSHIYILYPSATNTGGSADQVCGGILPDTFRIFVKHNDAGSYTYTVCLGLVL